MNDSVMAPGWVRPKNYMGLLSGYWSIYRCARKNAKQRGIPFELTDADFVELVDKSGHRCMISDLPFCDIKGEQYAGRIMGLPVPNNGRYRRNPYVPSIDRIDSNKGYTKDNCRLVVYMVNAAMNVWGEQPLYAMAYSIVKKKQQEQQMKMKRKKG